MKIAAYCRVSTDSDDQLNSFIHQQEFFAEYAQKEGHELYRIYADEGITGTSTKKRSEFRRLMRDAEAGLFEAVVVKDVSRFARNTVDFLQSVRKLKALGIPVNFLTANMTTLGDSELILTIFSAVAQDESANISKRTKWGKEINAKKGRVPMRVYGYNRVDNFTLEINEEEADVIREIYRLYLSEGLGCRMISMRLNEAGIKTKENCDWNPRGVRRVLSNSIYCGEYVNHKYQIEDFLTKKQVRIPPEQHFHHDRPEWAIVTREEYLQAQKQMEFRRAQYNSGEPFRGARYSNKHTFSTLIKCEHCGRSYCRKKYTYASGYRPRIYWKCSTNDQYTKEICGNTVKLEEDDLIEELRRYFSFLIGDRDAFVESVLDEVERQSPKDALPSMDKLEKKRATLLDKRSRYHEMYAEDLITLEELKGRLSSITAELEALNYDLKKYEQALAIKQDSGRFVERYLREIERFLSLETITNTDLRKIVDHIAVNKDGNVTISLKKFDTDFLTI